MTETIRLTVNGENHSLEIDGTTPLLYVLRNNLQLNAPKYGCGLEQCGSCMVLVDGEARPSCMTPCGSMQERDIITLEGMAKNGKMDPLQSSFIEGQAAQCGYCTSGMIITAKALLEKNKNPSTEEIKSALQRVLCRCGSQSRILKAVQKAIQPV